MTLVLCAYYWPFHMMVLDEQGRIVLLYRGKNEKEEKDPFHEFPLEVMIERLNKKDIDIGRITDVVVVGKPLFFFEKFLQECVRKLSFKNSARFARGVVAYLTDIFRLKRNLVRGLRFSGIPEFSFFSSIEAFCKGRQILGLKETVDVPEQMTEVTGPLFIGNLMERDSSLSVSIGRHDVASAAGITMEAYSLMALFGAGAAHLEGKDKFAGMVGQYTGSFLEATEGEQNKSTIPIPIPNQHMDIRHHRAEAEQLIVD